MLRYAAAAVTSLLLLLTVGGCGGDDAPAPKSEPSRTASTPAATHSPTPPTLPAAAKKDTKAGAKAFVRHFVDVLNYAGTHGETGTLRALYSSRCANCEALADGIDGVYGHGGNITGGGWRVHRFKYYGASNGEVYLDAFVNSAPQTMQKRAHGKVIHFDGAHNRLRAFVLVRKHHHWLVSGLDRRA